MVGVVLVVLVPSILPADQVSIVASRDNTLYEDAGGALSNGAGIHFFAGRVGLTGGGRIRRGLMYFDVATNVPSGSTINAATLQLNLSKTINAGSETVSIHRMQADWGEGASDALLEEGSGVAAMSGDATWVHTFFNTSFWAVPGGDFTATPSASAAVGITLGPYSWGSTPEMVQDVQDWLFNPGSNFGWLVQGDESTATTAKRFDTHENAVAGNRPTLTVDYTPAPAAIEGWMLY